MREKFFELLIIGLSAFVILDGDSVGQAFFPRTFWKQRVAGLEKKSKRDLWRMHREEWHLMQARLELSFAESAAQDEAKCLDMNSESCVHKAREPYLYKIAQIEESLKSAQSDYSRTEDLLARARAQMGS